MKSILKSAIAVAALGTIVLTSCKGGGSSSFTKYKSGMMYKIISGKGNGPLLKDSDFVKMHVIQGIGDSVLSSSYKQGEAFVNQIFKQAENPMDPTPLFFKMKAGDSLVIEVPVDSVFKGNRPPFAKKEDKFYFKLKLVSIFTKKEADSLKADMAAKNAIAQEQAMKAQAEGAKLGPVQDVKIKEYIKANGLSNAVKTAGGTYVAITTPGTGENAAPGKTVSMKYTGMLMDGKKFDSNVDPAFNHVEPFEFALGSGQVIPGWDEGIAKMNKGSKGILIIPSNMAYGPQGRPGTIPPNSVLRFEVEVLDIK